MTKNLLPLTDPERLYLRELRAMERRNEPFTHRRMCKKFGWRSVYASWCVTKKLKEKGYVVPGIRLEAVPGPVVTEQGQKELGERRAA